MLDIRVAGNAFTQAFQAANAKLQSLLCENGTCALPDVLHEAWHVKDAPRPLCFERGIAGKHDQRMDVLGWHDVQDLLHGLDVLVVLAEGILKPALVCADDLRPGRRGRIDVSTLFRTQNPIGFQSLLIGQWREIAIRGMAALTVIEHFDVFKHSCLGVFVRVKPLQINQLGL